MKKKIQGLLLASLFIAGTANAQNDLFSSFKKLEGRWKLNIDSVSRFEEWKMIGANHLKGRHYKVQKQDTIPMEYLEIRKYKSVWVYTVLAAGEDPNKKVFFALTKVKGNEYHFENQSNEYPKRIVYEITGDKKILAWIDEGDIPGSFRMNFPFIKLN